LPANTEERYAVKVVSKLVDLDFEVHRIEKHKNGIVVLNDPSKSMATKVQITPEDAMTIAKAIFSSFPALLFVLTFPFRYWFGGDKDASKNKGQRGRP
jgi:hypothetical protein